MVIENWTALLVLILLCVLLAVLAAYIARTLRQSRGARPGSRLLHSAAPRLPTTRLETKISVLPDAAYDAPSASLWQTLTRREKQVARLAAQKMSDAEIARELGISERTVGNHLYNIYGKLDINSRHELKFILRDVGNA